MRKREKRADTGMTDRQTTVVDVVLISNDRIP